MAISNHELWACASEVLRIYGAQAPRHIAERIGALALKGDVAGIGAWKEIARRFDALQRPSDCRRN